MIGKRPTKARYLVTYEQLVNFEKELTDRKTTKRREIWERVCEAQDENLHTRDEKTFLKIKDEQRRNEARISEIERVLNNCEVDIEEKNEFDTVVLGSKLTVFDYELNETVTYSIVDTKDANSLANKISNQSPLGKAFLGKRAGEEVILQLNTGNLKFRVIEITGMEYGYVADGKTKVNQDKMITTKRPIKSVEIFDISPKDFVTRVTIYKCMVENHQLIDIQCKVNVLCHNGKLESYTVPGAYCDTCKKFFMLESDYKRLKQKGILVCKVVEKDFWLNAGNKKNGFNLNQESLLHMMGYNVSQQANLSKVQRWNLLELIVDEGILTAAEIRAHLQWLIRRNQNNGNFADAIWKWKEDCEHLADYAPTGTKTVEVKGITNINYRKR